MRRIFLVIWMVILPLVVSSQITLRDNIFFETSDWFSVWTKGSIYYEINSDEVFVRINEATIEKNPVEKYRDYQPWISTIHVSISKRFYNKRNSRHTWVPVCSSQKIDISQPVPQPDEKIDLSCLPEVQCFEFNLTIPEGSDLSDYWLTITLTDPKEDTWYAHNNFYKSSFVPDK
ncbi:MAG: hypothetical protein WBA74_07205 [Cyclobacteriaceae bacterium]